MKKVAILLFILNSISIYAQDKFKLGVEVGPNISFFSGDASFLNEESLTSFNYGITAEYKLSEKISLKSGVLFETKGNTADRAIGNGAGDPTIFEGVENKLKYTSFPFLLKYTTSGTYQFFTNAGPTFSLLNKNNTESFVAAKDLDIAASLGIGLQRNINKHTLSFEIRYSKGMLDINSNMFTDVLGTVNNNSINAIVGYSINL